MPASLQFALSHDVFVRETCRLNLRTNFSVCSWLVKDMNSNRSWFQMLWISNLVAATEHAEDFGALPWPKLSGVSAMVRLRFSLCKRSNLQRVPLISFSNYPVIPTNQSVIADCSCLVSLPGTYFFENETLRAVKIPMIFTSVCQPLVVNCIRARKEE